MKKLIVPVLLVVLSALVTYTLTTWVVKGEAEAQGGFRAALLGAQLEFLKNTSILRPITDSQGRPDLQKYLQEVNTLLNWFYKNPAAKLWEQYPGAYDAEGILKQKRHDAEQEGPKQKVAKGNLPIWEECFALVKGLYDQFKASNYVAVGSEFQGSVRLDIASVKKDGAKLRWVIVTWGGIGPIIYNGWNMKLFKAPTAEEKTDYEKALALAKKRNEPITELKDPATLPYAESSSATGHPVLPDFEGADFVVDFPAGVRINYWDTPTCAPDTETVEMLFKVKARAVSGQDQEMGFVFRLPVDPSWKGSWEGVQKIEAASDYK